jgi:hypothetical protein
VELKPGTRFRSQVCETEGVVVKAARAGDLTCGGAPVVALDGAVDAGASLDPAHSGGTLLGKRYTDPAGDVEILCTKPGAGSLALDGDDLEIKSAKPLPASD